MNDCISRHAAIDWASKIPIHDLSDGRGFCRVIFADDFLKALKTIPLAQSRWIPCSERLPEARRSVILSTKNWTGEGCYWETTAHHVIWKGYRWNATYWDDEVIAWMPLPEPWEGKQNEIY